MLRAGKVFALIMMLLVVPAHAQRGGPGPERVLLGEKSVGFIVDRDVINITHNEEWFRNRSFRTLQFVAERNDVHLMSIRVVYMNGFAEDIKVDQLIRQRQGVNVDLRGDRSFLRRIEMVYRSRPSLRGNAVIKVYGETARPQRPEPPRPDPSWMLLGEKSVGFGVDRDVINIRHAEDWFRNRAFRELHFFAERNDVHLMSIRLVYFNGFAENIKIDKLIRAGQQLPVDLRGDKSFLRRIEMTYRARPNFRGDALVKVYGEPARGRR